MTRGINISKKNMQFHFLKKCICIF